MAQALPLTPAQKAQGVLRVLRDLHRWAGQLGVPAEKLALDQAWLQSAGLAKSQLHELLAAGTLRRIRRRAAANQQQPMQNIAYCLTPQGVRYAEAVLDGAIDEDRATPHYHARTRTLWWLGVPILHPAELAETQDIVLQAFQRRRWAMRIKNPLPPGPHHADQLRQTCARLKKAQKYLVFHAGGKGQWLRWEVRE